MKPAVLLILSAITALVAGAASGEEHYSINAGEFTRVKVIDGINVDYYCSPDSAGIVTFTADPSMASDIGFANNGGELVISLTDNDVSTQGRPRVTIRSSFLTSVENSGDSLVRIMTVASCPNFKVKQIGNGRTAVRDIRATRVSGALNTGNGSVVINGKCDEASLKLTGTGTVQADGLEAQTVKCSAFGTGTIGCHAVKKLKVHGMGSTKIYYRGEPEIKTRAMGVKIEPVP